jgi:tRNA pseudouridine55 synthase
MANGLIILHKEAGMTSHTAVNRVRRLLGEAKAGHTGTLDPMATGVLPILLGRAVKASEYITEGDKHYRARLMLGLTTDTEDITGQTLSTSDCIPTEEAVTEALSHFRGEIMQTPPMYSAIRVGGRRLMELARAGVTVDREARPITIHALTCEKISEREYSLDVVCSKGTYIRTLCADIGAYLGCGGIMAALERVEAAGFTLENAHTLSALEEMSEEARASCVIPVEELFMDAPALQVPPFYARLMHDGQAILQHKLHADFAVGTRLRLLDKKGFFALGEVVETDEDTAIKPIKLFVL